MGRIASILLVFKLCSLNSFAQSDDRPIPDEPELTEIRVTDQTESDEYITLVSPHIVVNDRTFRFSNSKNTFDGLCHLALNRPHFQEVDGEVSSSGTVFLNAKGKILRFGPIFQSLRFVKCLK